MCCPGMIRAFGMAAAVLVALIAAPAARSPSPALHFRLFAATGIPLTDVLWTGREFVYVENTTNKLWAAPASGLPVRLLASMPQQTEETRCRLSPGTHGWPKSIIYCHAPSNTIYRIDPEGSSVAVFATVPESAVSDGALAFDTSGGFGFFFGGGFVTEGDFGALGLRSATPATRSSSSGTVLRAPSRPR